MSSEKNRAKFDVFISYRRAGGGTEARLIKEKLEQHKFRVFLDVINPDRGPFDEKLLARIAETPNFVVVLSPNSLDRCAEENSWFRQEIACAVKAKRNIIPVLMPNFEFPRELPEDIRALRVQNGVHYSHEYFESLLPQLEEWVVRPGNVLTRHKVFVACVLFLIAVSAISSTAFLRHFYSYMKPQLGVASKTALRRRTVAVLNFKNSTSRPGAAWLSTALPDMLTTELAAGEELRIITAEEIARMGTNLSLPVSGTLPAQTLSQIGKALGVDLIVLGSYVDLSGGKLRLDLHLHDVASSETLISFRHIGDESNLFDLVSQAGAQLREKCNAGQLNARDESSVRATLPSNPRAARFYAEGLEKLRVNDAIAARDLLQKAVAADPNYALAHSALATAWSLLGYDEKARLSAKTAYDLSVSAQLSREDRLQAEARYREMSKEWDNAAESYRALFKFYPDNLEYGLLLARAQARGGKGKEALATVESLRRLSVASTDDVRVDLAASEAWRSLGDFKQCRDFAARAGQGARAQGARMLLARALYLQGYALENLGDASDALTAVEEAARIYQTIGDNYGLASTLEVTAQVLSDRGDYSGALAKYKEQLAVSRELGNRKAESSALNNMGWVVSQQGNAKEARRIFDQALPGFLEVGDRNDYAQTLLNIAGVMKDQGDLAAAKKTYDQALVVFREINDQSGIASSLAALGTVLDNMGDSASAKGTLEDAVAIDRAAGQATPSTDKLIAMGDVLQHLGDLGNARKNYDTALAIARTAADKSTAAWALMGLGSLDLKAADLAQSRKDYEEALSFRTALGEKDNIAATRVAMAELTTEEGHPDAGEALAREARDELDRAHKRDDQIIASATLLNALLAQGKSGEAFKELQKTTQLATNSQSLGVQLAFAVVKARAKVASRENGTARAILKGSLAKATKSGYLGFEFECRLALEELDLKSGKPPVQPERLQKEAQQKGFGLIARKAAAL